MAYRYRCGTCRASSPPCRDRASANAERRRHIDQVHGGYTPANERITHGRRDRLDRFRYGTFARAIALFLSLPVVDWFWRHR